MFARKKMQTKKTSSHHLFYIFASDLFALMIIDRHPQLLTEMDGTEDRKGVFVIAATNRPGMLPCSSRDMISRDMILFCASTHELFSVP